MSDLKPVDDAQELAAGSARSLGAWPAGDVLRLALEAGRIGIFEWHRGSGRMLWSESFRALQALPADASEASLSSFLAAVHPDDRDALRAGIAQARSRGPKGHTIEYRATGLAGELRWVAVRLIAGSSPDGTERVVGIATDVTDHRLTEQALDAHRRRLRLALDKAVMGEWERNVRTGKLIRSPLLDTLFGFAPGEAGDDAELFIGRIHPDDRSAMAERVATARRGEGDLRLFEFRIIWPDGTERWASARGELIRDASGEPERVVSVITDITDEKMAEAKRWESETRFQVSQEMSLDGFVILAAIRNRSGLIVDFEWRHANPSALRLLRHTEKGLLGRRFLETWESDPTARDRFQRYVAVVETGVPHDIEVPHPFPDEPGWFRNMAVKLGDGVAITFSDITQRRLLEQDRVKAIAEKDLMLKEVNHRVKNSLQLVSSLLSIHMRELTSERSRSDFRDAIGRVMTIAGIHQRLYRSDDIRIIDLAQYLRDLCPDLDRSLGLGQNRLHCDVAVERLDLAADTVIPLALIMNELITNAFKYAYPEGDPGQITVRCRARAGRWIRIVVLDQGAGLPEDFDPARHGSLGMKLVRSLVRQIGARLRVSRLEPGAAFRLLVPMPGVKDQSSV